MEPLKQRLETELNRRGRLLLALDGRCGCGKSTLAAALARELGGNVFHTDDFYLPFARRGEGWQQRPAGNMDLARLREEVLLPLLAAQAVDYRAYDCPNDRFFTTRRIPFRPLSIVEGSYSQHPALRDCYGLCLFLTAAPDVQRARLQKREGANFAAFEALWIPMEERYFRAFGIEQRADCVLDTGDLALDSSYYI